MEVEGIVEIDIGLSVTGTKIHIDLEESECIHFLRNKL